MRAVAIGVLVAWFPLLGPGCSLDECKNPDRMEANDPVTGTWRAGPKIKCNIVLVCPRKGGGEDTRHPLRTLEDPTIVDRGTYVLNRDGCRHLAIRRELVDPGCKVEASPEVVCLDVDASTGGAVPGTTTGTIVTVGVGAAGDFPQNYNDMDGVGGRSLEVSDDEQDSL